MDFNKLYIHRNNYEKTQGQLVYTYPTAVVNRGNAGISRLLNIEHPPIHWYDAPMKSSETIIALSEFRLSKKHIIFVKYIATPYISTVLDGPIDMQDILSSRDSFWIDC